MLRIIASSEHEFVAHWRQLLARDRYRNPLLAGLPAATRAGQRGGVSGTRSMTRPHGNGKQEANAAAAGRMPRYDEHSFIIANNDEPLLGCAITSHTNEQGQRCLGYRGNAASIVVNRNSLEKTTNNFSDSTVAITQQHMRSLLRDLMPARLEFMDPVHFGLLSPVTHTLLEHGGLPQVSTSQVVNLQLDLEQLYAAIAPDYQALIDWQPGANNTTSVGHNENLLRCLRAPTDKDELLAIMQAWGSEVIEQPARNSIASSIVAAQDKPQLLWELLSDLLVEEQGFVVTCDWVLRGRYAEQLDQPAALFVHNAQRCYFVMANVAAQNASQAVILQLLWRAMVFARDIGCKEFALEGAGLGQANAHESARQPGSQPNQPTTHPAKQSASQPVNPLQVEQFGGVPQPSMRISWS